MRNDLLGENESIEVAVSYTPFDHQSALSYFFYEWEEALSFVRLSMSHGFTVQISMYEKKE